MSRVLLCIECSARSEDGAGWRAELALADERKDEPELAVYCPLCWQREFGERAARL